MVVPSQSVLRDYILRALIALGGSATKRDVLTWIDNAFGETFTDEDRQSVHSRNEPKWENQVAWVRHQMVDAGLIAPFSAGKSERGLWALTENGWAAAAEIVSVDESSQSAQIPSVSGEEWGRTRGRAKHAVGGRAWLIRPGQGGSTLAKTWRRESFVSLSAQNLSIDTETATETDIREAVDSGYPHLDYAQRLQITQAAQAFIVRMSADDIVLTVSDDHAWIGTLVGEPYESTHEQSMLRRSVDWLAEPVARADLPVPVPGLLDKPGDVVDLTIAIDALAALAAAFTDTADDIDADSLQVASSVMIPDASDSLAADLFMPRAVLQEWLDVLADRRQMVFYGPPGTGKTFVAEALGRHIVGTETDRVQTVQFHPSYSYEDFFEGLRPVVENGNLTYSVVPGPLRKLVAEATTPGNESQAYVLIIDEMNRANLAKVFGELYYLLEYRDQAISLQYSPSKDFRLPKNLFIIGTMNTLDRSIAMVDAAIRRRFPFVELHPSIEPVSGVLDAYLSAQGSTRYRARLLAALNEGIDERDLQVGPSYLMTSSAATQPGLERIWKYDILPLLDDHFYGRITPEQVRAQFGLAALSRKARRGEPRLTDDGDAVEFGREHERVSDEGLADIS
ncbi:AAA family ATPase [Microbacterium sp. YY-01]|uniref:AAA family ATPase n=1 Tax=Microbacterium sp. YY-01 TaxID=3421634 RepID=UPI003D184768